MADRGTEKGKETAKPKGLVSSLQARSGASANDPFDDAELDAFLETTVDGVEEPKLVLRERLLTGIRTRREV